MESTNQSATEERPDQPVGLLLSKYGLIFMLGGLLLAAWFGQVVIVVLLGLVLSTAGLSKLWSRFSLVGVSCQHYLSEQRVFPGESIELKLRVANRKLLPLPWLQVDDEIPYGLDDSLALTPGNRPGCGLLGKSAALLWYTAVSWRHQLNCQKRGYYELGPIRLSSGDIFGFYPRSVTEPLIDHIIVYPRIYQIAELSIPSLHPLGETVAERRIFEDPTRVIGVRDYTPHDSLRHIHWKATARQQSLQVKVFEPTTTLKVALFLAVDSFGNGQRSESEFELGVSTAASVASYAIEQDSSVGLFVNTQQADTKQSVRIAPGSGTTQLVTLLEALAKVTVMPTEPFDRFLEDERRNLPWGTSLVITLGKLSESVAGLLSSIEESGYKLIVLQIGEPGTDYSDKIPSWYNIKHPGDLLRISSEKKQ